MRWSTQMPSLAVGDTFQPSELNLDEGQTQPPPLLSEADLISLMDSNGIGTDATMHAHIDTIVERSYAERDPNGRMKPTRLGMALVQAYAALDLQLWKPYLRAQMEKDLNDVAAGRKTKESVTDACLNSLKNAFLKAKSGSRELVSAVGEVFEPKQGGGGGQGGADGGAGQHVGGCKLCQMPMLYKHTANGSRMVGCTGYPQCRNSVWLPSCATKSAHRPAMRALRERAWQWPGQASLHVLYGVPAARAPPQYRRQDGVPWMCAVQFPASRALTWLVDHPATRAVEEGGSGVRSDGGGRGGARPKPERSDRWSRRWRVAVGAIRRQRCRRVEQHVLQMCGRATSARLLVPDARALENRARRGDCVAARRLYTCTRINYLIWIDRPRGGFTRAPSPARRRAVPPHPSTPGTARGG